MIGWLVDEYSRGWGHITTRQNIQFHFVAADARSPRSCATSRRSGSRPARRAATPCATSGLPSRRRVPARGARHQPVGRGRVPSLRAQPARPATAAQVQDQLLRLRDRLRSGDVQRRRRDRHDAHERRRRPSSRASACSSPAASAPTRIPRWRSRTSPHAKTCCRPSRRCCACSTRPATATTSCGPA